MRSAWQWCGMPLRRSRKRRTTTPSPPSSKLSLCKAGSRTSSARLSRPALSKYAEDIGSDGGLSDVDFSGFDEGEDVGGKDSCVFENHMVMDPVSRKWTGNEKEFEPFRDAVVHITAMENTRIDYSPFIIDKELEKEWKDDGLVHNAWLGGKDLKAYDEDIRDLVPQFCNRRGERFHTR